MTNVYLSQRLATQSDKFHLNCLLEKDNKSVDKQFVWIEFTELKAKGYPDQTLSWDNPSYIFGIFLTFLENYINKSLTPQNKEEFEDIYDYLDDDKVEDLLELLNTAKTLNWN